MEHEFIFQSEYAACIIWKFMLYFSGNNFQVHLCLSIPAKKTIPSLVLSEIYM